MRRGAIVVAAFAGDFGKPRPALVVQSDFFNDSHPSITVMPISGTIADAPMFRVTIDPTPGNGLRKISQIMVDKIATLRREKVGKVIGRIEDGDLVRVTRAMTVWLGIA